MKKKVTWSLFLVPILALSVIVLLSGCVTAGYGSVGIKSAPPPPVKVKPLPPPAASFRQPAVHSNPPIMRQQSPKVHFSPRPPAVRHQAPVRRAPKAHSGPRHR
ncbi:MAG: hypothetical protein A3A02_00005 [Candidatus Buchananbacteria bacterium RIFCSPLOWO2_01_FULL_39_33]|uniref:Uncharacterized protein n=1 Tax=Candidatus Buchananbacteria bacterium RIFCSPLOWO2_01_FULL_39_33 TaxID=1797543 RepID=A0A1G1YL58_9BACT|nr:MAG: hypothetical protein A2820_03345 [Candidatus Buchananbacteria bacterium RIFCSPHIGHO2_01_FULL_40_35]OGY53088.1 MAG: hypothetical protein A3A02_00005 [Candidatus Buchananbacteria bacterium RIFCSPLOWO2_01_FULL_39_33]